MGTQNKLKNRFKQGTKNVLLPWFKASVEQGFPSVFAKFLAYLMIFQSGAMEV